MSTISNVKQLDERIDSCTKAFEDQRAKQSHFHLCGIIQGGRIP